MGINRTEIAVIGGGASGLMAAIKAAEKGCKVTILEKNAFCGKKINITGKGRCNITNMRNWPEFSEHIHPSANFLRGAFYNFSNEAVEAFFETIGVPTTRERGERLFPQSMRAQDVSRALTSRAEALGVTIVYECDVMSVTLSDNIFCCHCAMAGGSAENIYSSAVIVATGGLSYPTTGSTGRGYEIAEYFGLALSERFPSLTALMPDKWDTDLQGIELKNVALQLFIDRDLIQMEEGDLDFTDGGIEGPLGFRISRKAVYALKNGQKVEVVLDLKPALSLSQLSSRIDRELASLGTNAGAAGSVKMRSVLKNLLPGALIIPFTRANPDLNFQNLPQRLKTWRFKIASCKGYERAVVTAGGVSQKEIISKTMRSRKIENLYFAGEVIDIDGDTGGYNLQIAFSTGALAGESAAQQILKAKESADSIFPD